MCLHGEKEGGEGREGKGGRGEGEGEGERGGGRERRRYYHGISYEGIPCTILLCLY